MKQKCKLTNSKVHACALAVHTHTHTTPPESITPAEATPGNEAEQREIGVTSYRSLASLMPEIKTRMNIRAYVHIYKTHCDCRRRHPCLVLQTTRQRGRRERRREKTGRRERAKEGGEVGAVKTSVGKVSVAHTERKRLPAAPSPSVEVGRRTCVWGEGEGGKDRTVE